MRELKTIEQISGAVSQETAELILASVSSNTLTVYRKALDRIETWLNGQGLTDERLAEYLTELFHTGKSPQTIGGVVAAVQWRAKHTKSESVVGPITSTTLAGIRREGKERGRGQVDGLAWAEVDRVCAYCEADNSVAGLRDASLIRLMSDCLLRVSEAVAVDIEDIKDNTLIVRSSKTDQEGTGEALFVCDVTIDLISRYQAEAELDTGALFRRLYKNGRPGARLTDRSARQIVKDRARAVGIKGFVSGHSLRVGSAESLAHAGASLVEMQQAGRWKDPQMPAHYARSEMASRGAVARLRNRKKSD